MASAECRRGATLNVEVVLAQTSRLCRDGWAVRESARKRMPCIDAVKHLSLYGLRHRLPLAARSPRAAASKQTRESKVGLPACPEVPFATLAQPNR